MQWLNAWCIALDGLWGAAAMEAVEIINNMNKNEKPYKRALILLKRYKDLKCGNEVMQNKSEVMDIVDKVIEHIKDDPYYKIIDLYYLKGMKMEEISEILKIDRATAYKHKRRLIKRIAVIIYGDKALL